MKSLNNVNSIRELRSSSTIVPRDYSELAYKTTFNATKELGSDAYQAIMARYFQTFKQLGVHTDLHKEDAKRGFKDAKAELREAKATKPKVVVESAKHYPVVCDVCNEQWTKVTKAQAEREGYILEDDEHIYLYPCWKCQFEELASEYNVTNRFETGATDLETIAIEYTVKNGRIEKVAIEALDSHDPNNWNAPVVPGVVRLNTYVQSVLYADYSRGLVANIAQNCASVTELAEGILLVDNDKFVEDVLRNMAGSLQIAFNVDIDNYDFTDYLECNESEYEIVTPYDEVFVPDIDDVLTIREAFERGYEVFQDDESRHNQLVAMLPEKPIEIHHEVNSTGDVLRSWAV